MVVTLTVFLQVFDDLPAIDQGLQFCRRAQVLEKVSALVAVPQAYHGVEEGVFGAVLLAFGFVAVGFHVEPMY
jgi:hypothetical protein